MTPNQAGKILESYQWTFAKTMAENPHYWTLLRQCPDKQEWFIVVRAIELHGTTVWFEQNPYCCLFYNGWEYWTMDPTVESTDLINRAEVGGVR